MFLLAISVAIFDEHTRLTCLETDNPHHLLLAAISAVADCRHSIIPVVTIYIVCYGGGEDDVVGGNILLCK
jgi:hypothetical protein